MKYLMNKYERIMFCFFGCHLNKIQETAIITNINPIFSAILNSGKVLFESKNFYSYAIIQNQSGCIFSLLGIKPGNCIIDVVKIIATRSKYIAFWGIGGSLTDDLSIGDVVEITSYCSISKSGQIIRKTSNHKGKTIAQTNGLVQSESFYYKLKQQNVDLVDMESAEFSDICEHLSIEYRYFVMVSDLPLKSPFYVAKPCAIVVEKFFKQIQEWIE